MITISPASQFHIHLARARFAIAQFLLYLSISGLLITGCTPDGGPSEFSRLADLAVACPKGTQLASYVAVDVSGSRSKGLLAVSDRAVIEQAAEQTAACSGVLKAVIFAGNATSTTTLYNHELAPAGATDIARFKRIPALVSDVMKSIDQTAATVAWPDPKGTDIVAQFNLAAEYVSQLKQSAGKPVILNLWILSDGFQSVEVDASTLTAATAASAADRINVPQLPGAKITLAGVGQTTSKDVPTELSEVVRMFWQRLCERTNAASCTILTDATQTGK